MTQFASIADLFKKYPWRTASKFIPLAKRYGFSEKEAKKFLSESAPHDEKIPKAQYLPIFSTTGGSYQFDILIQRNRKPFLVFININTRKAYAYEMQDKSSSEVLRALEKFFNDAKQVKVLTSDQDKSFLSNVVLNYLRDRGIGYRTTEANNHNILGIVNRFIRTLRDLNDGEEFTQERMNELIKEYNSSPHRSLNEKSPNKFTNRDEVAYIKEKANETKSLLTKFSEGERVRISLEKSPFGKRRGNLSKEAYDIAGKSGNQYIVKAADGSIDKYPAYRLIRCDNRYPLAKTIRGGTHGIVERINRYYDKQDRYEVEYDDGTIDFIPAKNLREGMPLKLSLMERRYWIKQNEEGKRIPNNIRKYWK